MNKRFSLTIDCDGAAFADDATIEIARILRHAAGRIETGCMHATLRDVNGNTVGAFELTDEQRFVYIVECPDGKLRASTSHFTTHGEALTWANWGHACLSVTAHVIHSVPVQQPRTDRY